jgi:C-terminal processing protease CtpA/Prc
MANSNSNSNSSSEEEKKLLRFSRQQRSANVDDRVVELKRPLGLVLNEDDKGNVYVETVAPRGNAARAGGLREGDVVTMCSATFGDQMWSTRGVGLTRVLAAIRVRAGPTVKLVFESSKETAKKTTRNTKAVAAAEEARLRAQSKKDQLLKELQQDEVKLKKGKFLGLF